MGSSVHSAIDIETIRVSAERDACGFMERTDYQARLTYVPQNTATRRRELLGTALLLTATMAPEAHAAAREAMDVLGVSGDIELYQSEGRGDTVRLAVYGNPIGVEFMGAYLARLDYGGLLAVLGHEIGHCVAHTANPRFAWALSACSDASTPDKRAYSMASEFTADRFGLLACRNLEAVLRLEMQAAAGRGATSLRFDTQSYLEQCRALAEETLARDGITLGRTHPEHYLRGYAEWLFSESDVYAAITGAGPGTRSLADVDVILAKLLRIPERAATVNQKYPQKSIEGARPSNPIAVVGNLDDERALQRAMPAVGLEDLATDILTDGARRKLVATGNALANAARAVAPSLRRLSNAALDHLGATSSPAKIDAPAPEGPDLLDEERNELLARFEELERNAKE